MITLDIETVPKPHMLEWFKKLAPEPWPDNLPPPDGSKVGNRQVHVKDAEACQERTQEWLALQETKRLNAIAKPYAACSLDPNAGDIVAIVTKVSGDTAEVWTQDPEGPGPFFRSLISVIRNERLFPIVTFNGAEFDLRFIETHARAAGIADEDNIPQAMFRRYSKWPHHDVMQVACGWDKTKRKSQAYLCHCHGIPHDDTVTGADVFELYRAGEYDKIEAHCKADVESLEKLYYAMKGQTP